MASMWIAAVSRHGTGEVSSESTIGSSVQILAVEVEVTTGCLAPFRQDDSFDWSPVQSKRMPRRAVSMPVDQPADPVPAHGGANRILVDVHDVGGFQRSGFAAAAAIFGRQRQTFRNWFGQELAGKYRIAQLHSGRLVFQVVAAEEIAMHQ